MLGCSIQIFSLREYMMKTVWRTLPTRLIPWWQLPRPLRIPGKVGGASTDRSEVKSRQKWVKTPDMLITSCPVFLYHNFGLLYNIVLSIQALQSDRLSLLHFLCDLGQVPQLFTPLFCFCKGVFDTYSIWVTVKTKRDRVFKMLNMLPDT